MQPLTASSFQSFALLKEAIPSLTKVGVFIGRHDHFGLDHWEDARRKLGLEFVPALIDSPEDIDAAFEKFAKISVKGVVDYGAGGTTTIARERIAALAIKHRMAMFGLSAAAGSGVLLSYGYDISALFKRTATLVDRILKGAKPADISVEQVNVYELVVNLRTARAGYRATALPTAASYEGDRMTTAHDVTVLSSRWTSVQRSGYL